MANHSTPVHSPFNGLPEEKEPEIAGPSLPPLTVATQQTKEREGSLLPPFKHVWIPSTGTRLTAMEVAQALSESPREEGKQDLSSASPATGPEAVTSASRPRLSPLPQIQAEKRRSNYEKYSAITLPPLKEEATPTPSPVGTLKRAPVVLLEDNTSYVSEKNQAPEQVDKPARQEMRMEIIHLPYNGKFLVKTI